MLTFVPSSTSVHHAHVSATTGPAHLQPIATSGHVALIAGPAHGRVVRVGAISALSSSGTASSATSGHVGDDVEPQPSNSSAQPAGASLLLYCLLSCSPVRVQRSNTNVDCRNVCPSCSATRRFRVSAGSYTALLAFRIIHAVFPENCHSCHHVRCCR